MKGNLCGTHIDRPVRRIAAFEKHKGKKSNMPALSAEELELMEKDRTENPGTESVQSV